MASVSHNREKFVALFLAEGKAIAGTGHVWDRGIALLFAAQQDFAKMLYGGLLREQLQAEIEHQVVKAATLRWQLQRQQCLEPNADQAADRTTTQEAPRSQCGAVLRIAWRLLGIGTPLECFVAGGQRNLRIEAAECS